LGFVAIQKKNKKTDVMLNFKYLVSPIRYEDFWKNIKSQLDVEEK